MNRIRLVFTRSFNGKKIGKLMIKTGSRKEYALFSWFSPEIELRLVFTRSFISDLKRKQKRIGPTLGASETERAFCAVLS